MTSSMVVPVIDVQNDNFKELWPAMVLAIQTSSFIALDTELSGLGARKALLAECIEERYKAICNAARTRSVLSLGFACYKKLDNKEADTYMVQVYNLTLLCSEEYVIEPQSVQFLVQHGFDFNKQYAQGVSYYKGNDKGSNAQGVNMRTLFTELLRARKPLVLHNGLIDMVFLYQCFYAHLPEKLGTFTADLSQMFPAGIYDTKYATEYQLRFAASYLEYAYKKCKLDNSRSQEEAADGGGSGGTRLFLEFCNYSGHMSNYVDYRPCLAESSPDGEELDVCQRFSAYGWCPNGSQCPQSHDTDLIIKQDEKSTEDKKKKKRKKRNKNKNRKDGQEEETGEVDFEGAPQNKKPHMDLDPEEGEQAQTQTQTETKPLPVTKQGNGAPDQGEHGDDVQMNTDKAKVEGNGISASVSEPQAMSVDGVTPDPQTPQTGTAPPAGDVDAATTPATVAKADAKKKKKMEGGTHRAGFDAFMTGYIFSFASTLAERTEEAPWLPDCLNKVYLSGKAVPLHIAKSTFSKSSKAHVHKMDLVWGKGLSNKAGSSGAEGAV